MSNPIPYHHAMPSIFRAPLLTAVVLVASGCGAGDTSAAVRDEPSATSSATATPTPSESSEPTLEPNAEYSTVDLLRRAAVKAGYVCKRWEQDNEVDLAAQSGSCSNADVFSTYASTGDLQAQLEQGRELDQMFIDAGLAPDPTLVGPNWIITGSKVPELAPRLGGTVVE